MSEIKIDKNHSLGKSEAHKRVQGLEPKLREKYGVKLDWQGDEAQVSGTGVSGKLSVADSRVAVELKLGMLLRPMASKIRDALERQIEKALT